MGRIVVAVAPDAGFAPEAVVAVWNADAKASAIGTAKSEAAGGDVFFPGLVELVMIPLAVNVASNIAYDLVKKLVTQLRTAGGEEPRVERPEVTASSGDVVIVIRGGEGQA